MQSDHEFAPTQIAAAEFPTAFRGYDQDAVRHYLTRLSAALSENGGDALAALARTTSLDRIEELEEENDTLRAEVRDLELELVQRSVEGPAEGRSSQRAGEHSSEDGDGLDGDAGGSAFDEHRAIELLGQETARVLESARSAAADIVKKAERHAKEIEKDARTDLADARRKARRIVAEKQAEAEELVAKVASEAEESAVTLRTEAEQHREMVLAESKKIMADAEEQAAADEKWAQDRAEQIVADAEALRQQLLSELVVERTKIRTDLEEMLSTRDRLVMALVVARSEMDDLSARLDEASVKPSSGTPDIEVDEAETSAQVDELVAQLDEQLDPDPGPAKSSKSSRPAKAKPKAKRDDNADNADNTDEGDDAGDGLEVIDLTEADGSPGDDDGGGSGGGSATKTKRSTSRSRGKSRKKSRSRSSGSQSRSGQSAKAAATSTTATAVADAEDTTPRDDETASDEIADDTTEIEVEADVTEDEATEAVDRSDTEETDDAVETDDGDDPSIELSLIEGFNTIELSEADLGFAREVAAGGRPGEEPEDFGDQILVTVASRETGTDMEGNRGDLLIDEEYRGRLPSAVAARDAALGTADDFHRSLRRALNDDQSEVLDRLRVGRGAVEVSELPKFTDQIERYLSPLRDGLAPVALAGAKAGGRREVSSTVLDNLVKQLAKYIVDKVRIPVIREVEHAADHDREKLFEPIRSVYRDFRNGGLLDLADDALYESFAIGLYGAIPAGSEVTWLLDPRHDPDPVCEINAGRAGLVKGEKFPSGHTRPLALPNCRCLVIAEQ